MKRLNINSVAHLAAIGWIIVYLHADTYSIPVPVSFFDLSVPCQVFAAAALNMWPFRHADVREEERHLKVMRQQLLAQDTVVISNIAEQRSCKVNSL